VPELVMPAYRIVKGFFGFSPHFKAVIQPQKATLPFDSPAETG